MLQTNLTDSELKSNIIMEIDKLNREQLLTIHQMVARLIAEDLVNAVTDDWQAGKVDRSAIQSAIETHRTKHPSKNIHRTNSYGVR